jgi:hypothetical protein
MTFMVIISSNTLSLETRQNVQVWSGNILGPCDTQKFKTGKSVGKVMVTVLQDCKGVMLVDFMEKGTTINAASYCATLELL